ncbi:hypothetical protein V8E51_011818 [Hyaloscypha variabilis]
MVQGAALEFGEKFAKSELKALMAVFVGTFQMEIADPNEVVTPAGAITTKPRMGGFFLKRLSSERFYGPTRRTKSGIITLRRSSNTSANLIADFDAPRPPHHNLERELSLN